MHKPMSAKCHKLSALQEAGLLGSRSLSSIGFLTLLQHWSGAVVCPACLCGPVGARWTVREH